jgi:hypothetical protein
LEKHKRYVRHGREERLDHVPSLAGAADAATTAALRPVDVEGHALDVAVLRDGHDHHLLGDQLLDVEARVDLLAGDLGAALVAVALLQLVESAG